jgi:RNA polymerase sigma-70 factor, ECF subfamily
MINDSTQRLAEFEQTALAYADQLYRVAARLTRNPSQAEDLVQEAYLQAWRSFERFTPGTNLRAWLYKIMFNTFYSQQRRKHELVSTEDAPLDTLVFEPPTPQHLTDEDVLAALEELPQHYQVPIVLADVEELSYQEISEALALPMGTVMSRLHRGRKLLRGSLATYAQQTGFAARAQRGARQ